MFRCQGESNQASRPGSAAAALALAGLLLTSLPAAADWLVTEASYRIQTRGALKVQGKLVVFTLPSGTLSSLRLAEVDLEASQELTAQAQAGSAAEGEQAREEPRRKPVLVLTDDDVGHVHPGAPESSASGEEAQEGAAGEDGEVSVTSWNQSFNIAINGVEITGSLLNGSRQVHTEVQVKVLLYHDDGRLAGRASAELDSGVLRAGRRTSFRASFPGILGFDRPEFRVESQPLKTAPPTRPVQEESPLLE